MTTNEILSELKKFHSDSRMALGIISDLENGREVGASAIGCIFPSTGTFVKIGMSVDDARQECKNWKSIAADFRSRLTETRPNYYTSK